ncbi:MAG: lipoyl synthase, partial [Candidatus Omnitrophica bacterium]|nr:lipoyl synthase [Candidatus Omnitrophota bacterium]
MSAQAGDSATGTKIIRRRLPDWLRKDLSPGKKATETTALLSDLKLNTICESGKCPNKNECFSQNTATIMILGEQCTRNCHYCAVKPGKPTAVDPDEPKRVLEAVKRLALEHVVITSVTRDDLPDEGIGQFIQTIELLRKFIPDLIIEVLTPDFRQN